MDRRHFLTATLLTAAAAVPAAAQTTPPAAPMPAVTPPTRVRGTIVGLAGNTLSVDSRDGQKLDILLGDPLTVVTVKKVDVNSITQNSYVGIATRAGADGKRVAIEVLVFPEAARGAGEGHYPWDLEPGSMMTNGTVKGEVSGASGRTLTVGYKENAIAIDVPPGTPVVTFAPATREDLKPGAKIFCAATKNADGKWTAARVTVEKDGVAPPM